jgi:hypothetical protein
MPCDDWFDLIDQYRISVSAYRETVEGLLEGAGDEFRVLWGTCREGESRDGNCSRSALES